MTPTPSTTPTPPAPSAPQKAPTVVKTVDVFLYPAYPAAGEYCKEKQIDAFRGKRRMATKIRATIPEADFAVLDAMQHGCVARV